MFKIKANSCITSCRTVGKLVPELKYTARLHIYYDAHNNCFAT